MIRIMVMNGLLISLILIWTSAAKEPSAGYLIKSSTKPPTGPLNYSVSKPMVSLHETNKEILRRKFLCGSELGGVCVNKKKSCPSNLPSEKSPGKPYCSKKKDRCCYPDPTTAAPPTVVPTTTTTSEDVNWSDIRNACIKSNNYKTYQPLALDICKEKCVEEDAINCQSIEYSSAQQMCAISEARSDSDDFIEPCFVDGWVFAEIELNAGPTTGVPTTAAPSNTTTNGPTTGPPTTMAPSNTTINVPTTDPPTTTAPSNTTTNVSCNLVWNYEEDRPLIMIRETKIIVPPIIDKDISEDPNRIPEGKKLIFACPGENNQFNHVQGTHTKLHGECISHEQFKVCVNNYPEILDLSQLSCSSKMQPSIIKQDNDTSYEKSCEDIGGELYKFGYIYGDYREFKDLDTKFCFREKDQTTLWTSTNIDRIEISPSMRSMDPANFRTARGLAMNTFYSQKSQQETLKEILDKEVTSVWNDKACRNHGGHCVRGGRPCPKHLPHHTSQGEPFCTSFYRCCYSEQCDPTTCIYKGQKGICSLDSLPGTTGVGSQECKKGCRCYIKDNKTSHHSKSLQERKEFSKRMLGPKPQKCTVVVGQGLDCDLSWPYSLLETTPATVPPTLAYLSDFGGERPLILDEHVELIRPVKPNRVSHGTKLIFACSGDGNSFRQYQTPRVNVIKEAKCDNGKLQFKVQVASTTGVIQEVPQQQYIRDMGCMKQIESTISLPKPDTTPRLCINGILYDIEFEISGFKPYPLITACFNKEKETTLWTKNKVHVKSNSEEYKIPKKYKVEVPWVQTPNFFTPTLGDIYKRQNQKTEFLLIMTKPIGDNEFFSKGHLVPRNDFVTKAEQITTYNYINALPQWQKYNEQNWALLEQKIDDLAKKRNIVLEIITGGSVGIMVSDKDPKAEIFLGKPYLTAPNNEKVPIPNLYWKVVSTEDKGTKAVAFVTNNNPLVPTPFTPDKPLCKDVCGSLTWLKKGDINLLTNKKFNEGNNPKKDRGHTYCCGVADLVGRLHPDFINIPTIPNIDKVKLLI